MLRDRSRTPDRGDSLSSRPVNASEVASTDLAPDEAEAKLAAGAQLIDVRQSYEWDAGHIDGAVHIPLEEMPVRASGLDRDREIVVACRTGSRSSFATAALREAGFAAFNLGGGLRAWVEAGKEIEPADGVVADPLPDGR